MSEPVSDRPPRAPKGSEASREVRRNRAIQRFRWLVLLAMLVAVVAVVALYLSGRRDRAEPAPGLGEAETEPMEPTGELVTVGEGFERTVTEGDRQIFTVRGERYAVDKAGIVFLEGVEVVVHREEGGRYEIEGAQARFDMEKRQGRLAGGVRVAAPDGMILETDSLRITNRGKQIRSRGPVRFELGEDYTGTAEGLQAAIPARRYLLDGLVTLDSREGAEEPFSLRAKGLILDRNRSLMRSRDWAVLRRRGERLSALEMHFFFAEDERTLRFVRAEGKVSGLLRSGGSVDLGESGAKRLGIEAGKMTLLLSEDGGSPRKLDLERRGRTPARVYTLGPPTAPRYRLTAGTITSWFGADGVATRTLAEGGNVVLVMHEPGDPGVDEDELGAEPDPDAGDPPPEADEAGERSEGAEGVRRRARGRTAEATFGPGGDVDEIELRGAVTLEDGELEARGERAVFRVPKDEAELTGRPAVATSPQGAMEAPRILYTRATGILHGLGGVRARIDDARASALGGSPLAGGDGPVRVEAEQGYLRDEPRTFLFVGDVRAWRGEDLLVAEELRGDDAAQRVNATGGVRTLWHPDETTGARAGASPDDEPIEVTAEELVYRRSERVLVYEGGVVAEQAGRTVAGEEMVLTLAEAGGLERLVASGGVEVDTPAGPSGEAKRLRGDRAVYDPIARTIDVTAAAGGKVSLEDGDGNLVEGPHMTYDIESDRVRVVGRQQQGPATAPGRERP